jgi:hypothetical protein
MMRTYPRNRAQGPSRRPGITDITDLAYITFRRPAGK